MGTNAAKRRNAESVLIRTKRTIRTPGLCEHILQTDALDLLQEPRKTREEVLLAIVSALGYTDVEVFKHTVESTNDTDDYFLGGMYRAVKAVEELFDKDSDYDETLFVS